MDYDDEGFLSWDANALIWRARMTGGIFAEVSFYQPHVALCDWAGILGRDDTMIIETAAVPTPLGSQRDGHLKPQI